MAAQSLPASPLLPDWLPAAQVLPTLLDISLTGVLVLRPLYAAAAGPIVDFAFVYVNATAQAMLRLPAHPPSMLTVHPHVAATGVFEFYRVTFEQGTPGRFEINYQHDGLDNFFQVAAQRSGAGLVVSLTDTANQTRTAVEEALRASQASERATTATLQQTNAELENRVRERTQALEQAQDRAERQRQLLEQFFEQAHAAICVLGGPELVYELVNPRYQQLYPDQLLLGRPILEAQPELADQPHWQLLRRVYETGETEEGFGVRMPLPPLAPNGSPREGYFNYIYQARYSAQGQIDGVLVCAFDVTEQMLARRQAEALQAEALAAAQRLATQRESFYQLFEQTPAQICLLRGPNYVLEYHNPAFQRLYEGRDLLGRPVAETQPEAVAQGFVGLLDRVYYEGHTHLATEVVGWVNGPNGGPPQERYFNFAYQPIREAGEIVGVSVFAFEVTEQVLGRQQVAQSQAQLTQLSQYLEQANQYLAATNDTLALTNVELLAASNEAQLANHELATTNQQLRQTNADLDNFIYTASHDLRTPITNIEGLLRALRTELPPAGQVADVPYMLELMQESVNRFKRTLAPWST